MHSKNHEKKSSLFEDTAIAFSHRNDKELTLAAWMFSLLNHSWITKFMISIVQQALLLKLPILNLIRKTAFNHFCGGENIEECKVIAENLLTYKVNLALDYAIEEQKGEDAFNKTASEIIHVLTASKDNPNFAFFVLKISGLADTSLLEKIQKKITLNSEEITAFNNVKQRVKTICKEAHVLKKAVLIDAEESWYQDTIDRIAYEMMATYNQKHATIFNSFQMYRKDTEEKLHMSHHIAQQNGYILGVKIVRGAYMEKEKQYATQNQLTNIIFPNKKSTDASFNTALAYCIEHLADIAVVCGSHNEYSNEYLTHLMQKHHLEHNDKRVWFVQLYGMGDLISFNLAAQGYNVAKYLPYGPVQTVMPYLLRRARENMSIAGQSSRELEYIIKERRRRKRESLRENN